MAGDCGIRVDVAATASPPAHELAKGMPQDPASHITLSITDALSSHGMTERGYARATYCIAAKITGGAKPANLASSCTNGDAATESTAVTNALAEASNNINALRTAIAAKLDTELGRPVVCTVEADPSLPITGSKLLDGTGSAHVLAAASRLCLYPSETADIYYRENGNVRTQHVEPAMCGMPVRIRAEIREHNTTPRPTHDATREPETSSGSSHVAWIATGSALVVAAAAVVLLVRRSRTSERIEAAPSAAHTARAPLPREDRATLVDLMAGLPSMQTEDGRIDAMNAAGLARLLPHIDASGPASEAVGRIVDYLWSYGKLENREALGMWIRHVITLVGVDRRPPLERLLEKWA